jgi:hypothetical protein
MMAAMLRCVTRLSLALAALRTIANNAVSRLCILCLFRLYGRQRHPFSILRNRPNHRIAVPCDHPISGRSRTMRPRRSRAALGDPAIRVTACHFTSYCFVPEKLIEITSFKSFKHCLFTMLFYGTIIPLLSNLRVSYSG